METEKSDTPLTDATDIATQLASQALLIELKCGKETGWIVQEAIKALRAAESAQAPSAYKCGECGRTQACSDVFCAWAGPDTQAPMAGEVAANTPIKKLLSEYASEGYDFADLEWVVNASRMYVDHMEDCQVRCLLHALSAQVEALKREADEDNDLIDRLSKLLAETSIALKGPELPLHRHSYHDVPKVAAEIALACRIGDELLRQEREKVAAAEQRADHLRAELDAVKVDAERYRWLRNSGYAAHHYRHLLVDHGWRGETSGMQELLDAAIDAARTKESGDA